MRKTPHSFRRAAAVVVMMVISGCSTLQSGGRPNQAEAARPEVMWALVPPALESHALSGVREGSPSARTAKRTPHPKSELAIQHPRVDEFVGKFETKSRGFFQNAFERSARYVPFMMGILEEEGVPPDLAYLPLIESAYQNQAVSRAGAAGPWQFMRGTAQRYGLRMDRYVDDRRDPEKSTRAAAHYLKDLHEMFGNWPLSLAAYNAGEFHIQRVQDRPGVDTFWDMTERGYLPGETRDYVPKFLAALRIARAPARYGFDEPEDDPLSFELVKVDGSIPLSRVARMAGVATADVAELNPALIRQVTPPDRGGYMVRIPTGSGSKFKLGSAGVLRYASAVVEAPVVEASYRVRKGDTPASIAKRFGVPLPVLIRMNGWKNPRRLVPGQRVRLPEATEQTALAPPLESTDVRVAAKRVGRRSVVD